MRASKFSQSRFAALPAVIAAVAASVWFAGCGTDSGGGTKVDPFLPGHQIALTYPKGGETLHVKDTVTITWEVKDATAVNSVIVRISPNNGLLWGYINHLNGSAGSTTPSDAEWEKFKWEIPDTINAFGTKYPMVNNDKVLVRVEQYSTGDTALMDQSRTTFKIVP